MKRIEPYRNKRKSITKCIEGKLGGKWMYNREAGCWECDDEDRVVRACRGIDDFDWPSPHVEYWLYYTKSGKHPEPIMGI